MQSAQVSILDEVTEKIMSLLDKVSLGDVETWLPLCGLARNPASKHTYTSLNQLLLSFAHYEKNYAHNLWLTFKQIAAQGGTVKKDEKGTPVTFTEVIYLRNDEKYTAKDAKRLFLEAKEKDPAVSTYKDAGIHTKRFLKYYWVFNVAQTSGLPENILQLPFSTTEVVEPTECIRSIIDSHNISITHVAADDAFYDKTNDKIQMPFIQQFNSMEHYIAVLLHEMVHWTGHATRLNRLQGKKNTPEYAFEELIAELGSAFLCAQLGIPASLTSSSAYLKSWIGALKNDRAYILKAVSYAEKASSYLLETKPELSFVKH